MLEIPTPHLPGPHSHAASAINSRLLEVGLISLVQTAISRDQSIGPQNALAFSTRIAPALHNIHTHPERHWTTASMAESAGMSRSLFCKSFREAVGSHPIHSLKTVRVELAARLLSQTGLHLSYVSHR